MGKTGETNGVEELLDATCDDVGTGDHTIIFEELGEEGEETVLEAPPSPCPTEVIDQWSNWREDEAFAPIVTPRSSPPGSVAPPGSPISTPDGYATPVSFGSGLHESIVGPEGSTESASYGSIFYPNVASNNGQTGVAGAQNYMAGGIVPPQGFFRNIPPAGPAFIPLESNERPYVNLDTNGNAPPAGPQLAQYYQQQHHNYTPNVPPATAWMQHVPAPGPAVPNFAPLIYAVQGNFPAGQGSGGTILGPNGGGFVGTPAQTQPVIFVQQPIFPQQQGVYGMPQQVMIDQYGNHANPRSAWDSLLAQGGHNRVKDLSTTDYYTAYDGSGSYGGESVWNGGVASESATYYSYGASYSTSEGSSVQSQSLSPTKSDYSSTDASDTSGASIASYSSIASSDQSYAPIAWTQHPTFPLSQTHLPQQEFLANGGIFTGGISDSMYQSSNFPVIPANFPAPDHSLLQAVSSQFDALNFASSANPKVSSSAHQASSLNGRHPKGKGYFVRNKKKTSAEKPIGIATTPTPTITPTSSYVAGCGNTFLMNGAELPYVLNIWEPSVTAMTIKMAPPQGYQYYVPPCVDDCDYFGGQLALWHFRMVYYFKKFSPDIWRLQAVPDTSQNIVDGWFSFDIISKLRFCCRNCKMPWTTKKGKLQFFIKRHSENRFGYVYFKMFRQVCMKQDCPDWTLQNAACYPEEIDRAVSKLCEVVSSMYYGKALDPNLFTDCQKSIRVGPTDLTRLKSLTTS